MSNASGPYLSPFPIQSRLLDPELRQRVRVDGYGYGTHMGVLLSDERIIGATVRLDSGKTMVFGPAQVVPIAELPALDNVVQFRRLRVVGQVPSDGVAS